MPVYLVSWTDGECMLVRAGDETDLVARLDQFGDPEHASWTEYDGPFAFSLTPFVYRGDVDLSETEALFDDEDGVEDDEFSDEDEFIEDDELYGGGEPFVAFDAKLAGDEELDLTEALMAFAFPRTLSAQNEAATKQEDAGLELLLEAEIVSKGANEASAQARDKWIHEMLEESLRDLTPEEREERLDVLYRVMGWRRSGE